MASKCSFCMGCQGVQSREILDSLVNGSEEQLYRQKSVLKTAFRYNVLSCLSAIAKMSIMKQSIVVICIGWVGHAQRVSVAVLPVVVLLPVQTGARNRLVEQQCEKLRNKTQQRLRVVRYTLEHTLLCCRLIWQHDILCAVTVVPRSNDANVRAAHYTRFGRPSGCSPV